ncbi:MAG: allantoinase AllB [Spirochaetia bacterium]|nr:allantoinase AllB [Spirochaetia bacterium]
MTRVLISKRIVFPDAVRSGCIVVKDNVISEILPLDARSSFAPGYLVEDFENDFILPGVVDTHVHINEPGRTEWEGFGTATKSAARGGITTLVDMPLNCIPATVSAEALAEKIRACENKIYVDCGFYGGIIPGNLNSIEPMVDAGVLGFKSFMTYSGVDEFPRVDESDMRKALPFMARQSIPWLMHAELSSKDTDRPHTDPRSFLTFMNSRPRKWENDAVDLLVQLASEADVRFHVVHLSSSDALPILAAARSRNLKISAETCHHYLTFAAEEIPDGRTEFKCAPPIREKENQQKLWDGLKSGSIDFVVSDHSPCTPGLKLAQEGDFMRAWGGIAGLQLGLSIFFTEAMGRGIDMVRMCDWLCRKPADFVGLKQKGRIAQGCDADLVIWDETQSFVVRPEILEHRHPVTPYMDRRLHGIVKKTYLRGTPVYENGNFAGPFGSPLLRK